MDFKSKLTEAQGKMGELKAKIDTNAKNAKAAREKRREEFEANLSELGAELNAMDNEINAQIESDLNDFAAELDTLDAEINAQINSDLDSMDAEFDAFDEQVADDINDINAGLDMMDEAFDKQVDDDVATIEGDINAAKENVRLAKERTGDKIDAIKLKLQMNIDAAKAKISDSKKAVSKANQEQHISDLLEYADNCQQLAFAMALEAELTLLEADTEIADYNEKYGNK